MQTFPDGLALQSMRSPIPTQTALRLAATAARAAARIPVVLTHDVGDRPNEGGQHQNQEEYTLQVHCSEK